MTRSFKFHNGKSIDCIKGKRLKDTYAFTEYMIKLCNEANKICRTKFIAAKEDAYNNWSIKIKTENKEYFNIIIQRFIKHFGDCISEIKF